MAKKIARVMVVNTRSSLGRYQVRNVKTGRVMSTHDTVTPAIKERNRINGLKGAARRFP